MDGKDRKIHEFESFVANGYKAASKGNLQFAHHQFERAVSLGHDDQQKIKTLKEEMEALERRMQIERRPSVNFSKGGSSDIELKQREEGDERGGVEQDKEPSRSLHKKEDEDEVEQRSRIYHFVEHMKNPNLTIPEALQYIQAYFINLEKGTEQGQYENLVSTYTRYQQQTRHGNPSAITILSLKDYPVSTAAVRRIKDDASAPPSEHSEQQLFKMLGHGPNGNGLFRGHKAAIYTRNSPCMLLLREPPCIQRIRDLARGKEIKDMMVQYDVFYEYRDYKTYQEKWSAIFNPVKGAVLETIVGKLTVCKKLLANTDIHDKKMPSKVKEEKGKLSRYLTEIQEKLTEDKDVCIEAKTFTELPISFAGHIFQQKYGKMDFTLIWNSDKEKTESRMALLPIFTQKILLILAPIEGYITAKPSHISKKFLEDTKQFVLEMYHIYGLD